jgi:hypothetical protein
MQQPTYPRASRWDRDGDRLKGPFVRTERDVTVPRSEKVADVLVLVVDRWLWTLAPKLFAARLEQGGVCPLDIVLIEQRGTTTLNAERGLSRRDYRFSVNGEVIAL